jgi:hypothetical protein
MSRVCAFLKRAPVTPRMRSLPSGYSFSQVMYSRAQVVMTSTSCFAAIRSAISRQ